MAAVFETDKLKLSVNGSDASMITSVALLAAAFSAPPPQHLRPLISIDDYPSAALQRGEQGAAYFQVVITPEGGVDSCTILLSTGYKDVDDRTCEIITKRARFSPAKDQDDRP